MTKDTPATSGSADQAVRDIFDRIGKTMCETWCNGETTIQGRIFRGDFKTLIQAAEETQKLREKEKLFVDLINGNERCIKSLRQRVKVLEGKP